MKRWILIGMVIASGMTIQAQNKLPKKFPYQDTSLTAEEWADDLLKTGEAVTEVQQSTPFLFNTDGAAPFARELF
ncbi:hypothetical protein [Bacteroides timonensis]|uniref:hypothetical protein n=1 Tax=Bacteroides timonensis TaxID=1470345 RepID=UPI0004B7416E|nr:hypothetical protein [Bacteroides timonensis]